MKELYPDEDQRAVATYMALRQNLGKKDSTVQEISMRRIKKAHINRIALVPRGANQLPVLYKSDEQRVSISTLIKDDIDSRGEITAIVYAPEMRDSQGDIASAEVIKEMSYEFSRSGLGDVDLRHDDKPVTKEQAFVAETFIVQKGDERFVGMKDYSGNDVGDLTGAWAVVIKVEDENLKKLYKEGKWNGVSMAGPAEVEYTEKEDLDIESFLSADLNKADRSRLQQMLNRISNHLGLSRANAYQSITLSGDIDMKPEELAKAISDGNADLAKNMQEGVATAVTQVLTKAGLIKEDGSNSTDPKPKAEDALVFKGDITDPKAVKKFEYDTKRAAIEKSMDRSDPSSIADAAQKIEELNKEYEEVLEKKETTPTSQRAAPSNVPPTGDEGSSYAGLTKEESECVDAGLRIAGAINKNRGMAS